VSTPTAKPLWNYSEPTKIAAREQALAHAVELLTIRRGDAAIVPEHHVDRVKAALLASDTAGYPYAGKSCSDDDISSWKAFRSNALGKRKPEELTVAYLAGPQPSNDLAALVKLGLRPENIWAFEIGAAEISKGLADLDALGLRGVKFIPVSIDEYFVGTPRRFDITYIDACGPLPSDSHKTTRLLIDIFKHGALAPLGVLVTNFSRPDISKSSTLDVWPGGRDLDHQRIVTRTVGDAFEFPLHRVENVDVLALGADAWRIVLVVLDGLAAGPDQCAVERLSQRAARRLGKADIACLGV
jgi:hypothetical protein